MTSCTDVKIQRKAVRARVAGKERGKVSSSGRNVVTAFYLLLPRPHHLHILTWRGSFSCALFLCVSISEHGLTFCVSCISLDPLVRIEFRLDWMWLYIRPHCEKETKEQRRGFGLSAVVMAAERG